MSGQLETLDDVIEAMEAMQSELEGLQHRLALVLAATPADPPPPVTEKLLTAVTHYARSASHLDDEYFLRGLRGVFAAYGDRGRDEPL